MQERNEDIWFRIVFVVVITYYIRYVCAYTRVLLSIYFYLNRFSKLLSTGLFTLTKYMSIPVSSSTPRSRCYGLSNSR